MATESLGTVGRLHTVGAEELRRHSGWFMVLGILQLLIGFIGLGSNLLMTLVSVLLFGWLLIGAAFLELVLAFRCRGWGGFFVDLLTGLLYLVVGVMIVTDPAQGAATLTLLIALYLMFGGIFRLMTALLVRLQHRGWLALHALIMLALGVMIWRQWPWSGIWVIGLFVAIDLICNGWTLLMLALVARRRLAQPAA